MWYRDVLSHNTYAYALNNPIMNYDDGGTFALAIPILAKGLMGIIGAITAYYVAKKKF